jgi:hypothetical protein
MSTFRLWTATPPLGDWESPGFEPDTGRVLPPRVPDSGTTGFLLVNGESAAGRWCYTLIRPSKGLIATMVQGCNAELVPDQSVIDESPRHRWN